MAKYKYTKPFRIIERKLSRSEAINALFAAAAIMHAERCQAGNLCMRSSDEIAAIVFEILDEQRITAGKKPVPRKFIAKVYDACKKLRAKAANLVARMDIPTPPVPTPPPAPAQAAQRNACEWATAKGACGASGFAIGSPPPGVPGVRTVLCKAHSEQLIKESLDPTARMHAMLRACGITFLDRNEARKKLLTPIQ